MDSPSPWPPPFPSSPSPPSPDVTEEDSSLDLWYVGAIINVVGSVSINLGMNLMKLGHNKRGELDMPEEEKPPIRKFKSWVVGLIIFITGNVLNFVSFAFAAQSLLAALGSLQLVCNVFFAYMVNKEPVTKLIIFSTGCIIGGCVLLVVFGNQSSETYTVDELIDFYKKPAYIVYLVMMGVVVFGTYVLYLHSKKVCRKRGQRGVWYFLMLISYSVFSAMLGSQSVLFGKSISVILRTTFSGDNQLGNWYTWVVLPVFTFAALFWVTRLNKGLRMFPAMVIVPLMQICWTLFSIVSGMIYFEEYKGFTTLMWIMFPVGVVIVFSGVFLLTLGGGRAPPPDELEEEEKMPDSAAGSLSKMTVHENAMFTSRPDGETGPLELGPPASAKMSLGQTLRFTSTWAPASVAVSPGSNMNRTLMTNESLRRQRRPTEAMSDLNATSRTNRTDDPHNYDKNSTLNRTAQSNTSRVSETPSMMGTMKKGIKSMHNRLTSDLGIETKTGFKLAMGLGDGALSGVSLFAMPALDFTSTKRTSRSGASAAQHNGAADSAILSALPRSKFFGKPDHHDGLTTIAEGSGLPKAPSSELGASLTASSQLPSSREGHRYSPVEAKHKEHATHGAGVQQEVAATGKPPSNKPLGEAAFVGLLPGPSFKPSRAAALEDEVPRTPSMAPTPAGAGSGPNFRVGRSRNGPAEVSLALPAGFAPVLAPGSAAAAMTGAAAATLATAGGTDFVDGAAAASYGRPAAMQGGGPAPQDMAMPGPGASGPGRPLGMPRPGSLAAMLPDGVPLSSAGSMVLHDSRPSTPPEVMLAGVGASGNFQGVNLQSPRLQQQQVQQQYMSPIPYSVLQRAHTPPLAGSRLPAPHLLVPGMPVVAHIQPMLQPAVSGGHYAQMLAGQHIAGPDLSGGGLPPTLSAPPRVMTPVGSLGGAGAGSTGSPSGVLMASHNQSPRGLSVSRSWAGSLGGVNVSRSSPLRGSVFSHFQRPLRPWQG